MTLIERLKKRISPTPGFYVNAVGIAGCAAAPAVMQMPQQVGSGYTGTFTIGGPDVDMQAAVARIEALESALERALKWEIREGSWSEEKSERDAAAALLANKE